ncbi:MAG: hypothetical protein RIB80_09850 [Rhodospirillales bacterium]
MLDEEFSKQHLKEHPVSTFEGVWVGDDDDVQAIFINPMVRPHPFAVGEIVMFQEIMRSRHHQTICPQDTRDAAELAVYTKALRAVQKLKLRLGVELQAPLLDSIPHLQIIQGGLNENLDCER